MARFNRTFNSKRFRKKGLNPLNRGRSARARFEYYQKSTLERHKKRFNWGS